MTDYYRPLNRAPQRSYRKVRPVHHAQPTTPVLSATSEEPALTHELKSLRDHLLRMIHTAGHSWATAEHDVLLTPLEKVSRLLKRIIPAQARNFRGWEVMYFASLVIALAAIPTAVLIHNTLQDERYVLSAATKQLVGGPVVSLDKQLQYDTKTRTYRYNPDAAKGLQNTGSKLAIGGSKYYGVDLSANPKKGQTFTDAQTKLSFGLVPEFGQLGGKHEDGHIVYPTDGGQVIYTLKNNGLKEDVVLTSPTDTATLTYKLQLPNELEARLLSDGSVGIYSADPALFANISFGTDKDKNSVESARLKSKKTNLVFQIPAPLITESGKLSSTAKAAFSLKGTELTVHAPGLSNLSYPISIDPSVVITSANSFTSGNNEDNNATITSSSLTRTALKGGTVGSWTSSGNVLTTHRYSGATVAYNGFIYVIGGQDGSGGGANTSVEYASLNSGSGAVGTWATSTSTLTQGRANFAAVTYNGYLYALGGQSGGGTAFSSVEYALICTGSNTAGGCSGRSAGDIGTWGAPKIGGCVSSCGDTLPSTIWRNAAAVYDGYIYSVAGCAPIAAGACSSGPTNNVYSAHINADGTLGSWSSATNTNLTTRWNAGAVVYNGYLYAIGGCESYNSITKACNQASADTVQYAAINPTTGALSSWNTASTTFAQQDTIEATVSNGYLYATGGTSNTMLYAPIYADGDTGPWNSTTTFATARNGAYFTSFNGYLYITNGCTNAAANCASGFTNDAQYTKIDPPGGLGSSFAGAGTLPTGLYGQAAAATSGYLYLIGGDSSTDTPSTAIQFAKLSPDGTLGAWATMSGGSGPTITGARFGAAAVAVDNFIYVSGGNTGSANATPCSDIQFAKVSASTGNFSTAWTDALTGGTAACANADMLNGQPGGNAGRYYHQMVSYNNYIYILGGINTSNSNTLQDVQFAQITPSTGLLSALHYTHNSTDDSTTFASTGGTMMTARNYFGAVIANGYIYVAGGKSSSANTTPMSSIEAAKLQNNGTVGAWSSAGSMPNSGQARFAFGMAVSNGNLYIIGGMHNTPADTSCNASSSLLCSDVWYAPICNGTNSAGGCSSGSPGAVGTWVQTTSMSAARQGHKVFAINGNFYFAGGTQSGGNVAQFVCVSLGSCTIQTDVQYSIINNGGGGGGLKTSWTTNATSIAGPFPNGWAFGQMYAYNGYLYAVGGQSSTTFGMTGSYYAPINADGTVGSWTAGPNLNTGRYSFGAVTYNGYIYAISGQDSLSNVISDVEYAQINSNGSLGSWQVSSGGSLAGRQRMSATTYNGYMYLVGGSNNANTPQTSVQYAPINSNGSLGTWNTTNSFTTARYGDGTVAYNGYLYVVGGYDGSTYLADVQYAPINSNGTVGTWNYTASLSRPMRYANVFAANGFMYVVNGGENLAPNLRLNVASINSSGTLDAWQLENPAQANQRTQGEAVYYNGILYSAGGWDGVTTYPTDLQYMAVNHLDHTAHYSRFMDLASTVNGNGDGNPEITRYGVVSSNSATLFGVCSYVATPTNVVFGSATCDNAFSPTTPANVKNISNTGRYLFTFLTIDDSGISAFPDTSTSVSEMDAYFHASPGRRLRGGKSTIDLDLNGTQQITNSQNGLPVMQQLDTEGSP